MDSSVPFVLARDFYDRFNDRGLVVRGSVAFAGLMLLLIVAVANPSYLLGRQEGGGRLVIAWLLLAIIPLVSRRLIVDLFQGFCGTPALRVAEEGIWSRRWSQLGWISWNEVAAVVVVSRTLGKGLQQELRIELHDGKYEQLAWNDQLAQQLIRLLSSLFGARIGSRTLCLASSTSLAGSWERLMVTLDPILTAQGIWKREDPGANP